MNTYSTLFQNYYVVQKCFIHCDLAKHQTHFQQGENARTSMIISKGSNNCDVTEKRCYAVLSMHC